MEWPEIKTDYPLPFPATDVEKELAELRAFKEQWEPVLIQMVPALVSIVRLATGMLPPQMQAMIPPQVLSFVESTKAA
jgi:hypothetical protein